MNYTLAQPPGSNPNGMACSCGGEGKPLWRLSRFGGDRRGDGGPILTCNISLPAAFRILAKRAARRETPGWVTVAEPNGRSLKNQY